MKQVTLADLMFRLKPETGCYDRHALEIPRNQFPSANGHMKSVIEYYRRLVYNDNYIIQSQGNNIIKCEESVTFTGNIEDYKNATARVYTEGRPFTYSFFKFALKMYWEYNLENWPIVVRETPTSITLYVAVVVDNDRLDIPDGCVEVGTEYPITVSLQKKEEINVFLDPYFLHINTRIAMLECTIMNIVGKDGKKCAKAELRRLFDMIKKNYAGLNSRYQTICDIDHGYDKKGAICTKYSVGNEPTVNIKPNLDGDGTYVFVDINMIDTCTQLMQLLPDCTIDGCCEGHITISGFENGYILFDTTAHIADMIDYYCTHEDHEYASPISVQTGYGGRTAKVRIGATFNPDKYPSDMPADKLIAAFNNDQVGLRTFIIDAVKYALKKDWK